MTGVFISWSQGHGRTSDLAQALGLRAEFVFSPGRGGILGRYLRQWRATRTLLVNEKPDVVWVQLPPAIALVSFWGIRNYRPKIVADLHTGFFLNPVWRWAAAPSLRWLQRRRALAVVTNEYLKHWAERAGLQTFIMHDVITPGVPLAPAGHVLCPLSYANDEPITEILGAAALTPDVTWVCTGNAPDDIKKAAPENVRFTGFIDRDEYVNLLRSASIVCALTTRPHTMQRAGYEALEYSIPLVTSDFPELRSFFGEGASYSQPNRQDIALKVRKVTHKKNRVRCVELIANLQTKVVKLQEATKTSVLSALKFNTDVPMSLSNKENHNAQANSGHPSQRQSQSEQSKKKI